MLEAGERIQVKVEREDDDWRVDDPMGTSRGVEVKREPGVGRKQALRKKLKRDPFIRDEPNCQYSTKNKSHFTEHVAVHSDERPRKCHKCQKTFKTSKTLKNHLGLHSEETPFQCDKCERAFKLKSSLICHQSTHKNRNEWFKCEKCEFSSPRKGVLKQHETIHVKSNPLKCEHCDYSCKSKRNLVKHLSVRHSTTEPWRCDHPGCPHTTRDKYKLKRHKIFVHESKKSFECEDCPRAFNTQSHLKRHSFVHTRNKPFKCHKCRYSSLEKRQLQVHERRKHVDEKEHKCDECGASYRLKDDLEKHKLNHDDTLKTFKCHLCPYKARKKWNLKIHLQLRKNIKGRCNRDYRTNNPRNSSRLVTIHSVSNARSGEKCEQCGLFLLNQSDSAIYRDSHRPCFVLLPKPPDSGDVIVDHNAPPFLRRVKIEVNDDVIKKEVV